MSKSTHPTSFESTELFLIAAKNDQTYRRGQHPHMKSKIFEKQKKKKQTKWGKKEQLLTNGGNSSPTNAVDTQQMFNKMPEQK